MPLSNRMPRPRRITQRELRSLIALQRQVDTTAGRIRRRLEAGATLDAGALGTSTSEPEPMQCTGYDLGGLLIEPAVRVS